jgi:virginiamycin B lyase
MIRTRSILSLLTLVTLDQACAPPDEDVAEVTANVVLTTPDVRCIVLKAAGTATVSVQADVDGPMTSVLALTGVAAGATTFTASAYAVKCASTGSATATYVSDPVMTTVFAGAPLSLTFKMRPASAGTTTATLDFPDAKGRIEDFRTWINTNYMPSIVAGPDGNLWFTMGSSGLGIMSPDGWMIETRTPYNYVTGQPFSFNYAAVAPDDTVWFTDTNSIGRMTASGLVKTFYAQDVRGGAITAGADGNMWFTTGVAKIGKITPFGETTYYAIPSQACFLVGGPDGAVWFTECGANKIGKVQATGAVTEYPIPTANARPWGIAVGGDGNLWFAENGANKVGRITTAGAVTEFGSLAINVNLQPLDITRGPDGNLWATCDVGAVAKITTAGAITVYPASDDLSRAQAIVAGPDANMWFTEPPMIRRIKP